MNVLDAVRGRRSWSKVTDAAPSHAELLPLIAAASRVADHSSLRPWRLIELRGQAREVLGRALHAAEGEPGASTKPLRAPLLIAVVVSYRRSGKVPRWEQEAVASGVAHTLTLLLDEAGWGVIWRTGPHTRAAAVAAAHGLTPDEELLGWLYVGGKPADIRESPRRTVDPETMISALPSGDPAAAVPSPRPAKAGKSVRAKKPRTAEEELRRSEEKAAKKAKKAEKKARARPAGRSGLTPQRPPTVTRNHAPKSSSSSGGGTGAGSSPGRRPLR